MFLCFPILWQNKLIFLTLLTTILSYLLLSGSSKQMVYHLNYKPPAFLIYISPSFPRIQSLRFLKPLFIFLFLLNYYSCFIVTIDNLASKLSFCTPKVLLCLLSFHPISTLNSFYKTLFSILY